MPEPAITPDLLLEAYRAGAFPMAPSRTGRVRWYTADPRAILPLDAFNVPRSLRKALRAAPFTFTRDAAFEQVIAACAQPRPYEANTWINDEIIAAYTALHHAGHAHSVEAWASTAADEKPRLVGGLYGVALGAAFFGESMFSLASNASKACLVHLVDHLNARGFTLLDTQFHNPHLEQFGLTEVPLADYLRRLRAALDAPDKW